MLDKQNVIVENLASSSGNRGLTEQVCHEVYVKMVDYLRLTQSKNTYNRFTDYHYLNIPVSNSTEPIRGIDYIQPIVAPGIDLKYDFLEGYSEDVANNQVAPAATCILQRAGDRPQKNRGCVPHHTIPPLLRQRALSQIAQHGKRHQEFIDGAANIANVFGLGRPQAQHLHAVKVFKQPWRTQTSGGQQHRQRVPLAHKLT